MDLLAWVFFLFLGWGSPPTLAAAPTPDTAVSAPAQGVPQVQAMHDGTPIPPN